MTYLRPQMPEALRLRTSLNHDFVALAISSPLYQVFFESANL